MTVAYLRPGVVGTYDQWLDIDGAGKVAAIDPGAPFITHNEDVSRLDSITAGHRQSITVLAASVPARIAAVSGVRVKWRARCPSVQCVINGLVRLGGTDSIGANVVVQVSGSYADYTTEDLARPGGGTWTAADLAAMEFGLNQGTGSADIYVTTLWSEISYSTFEPVSAERDAASRRLRLNRLPGGFIDATLPTLEYLDHELLDLMAISHPDLPSADGRGAGVEPWERWPVLKVSSDVDWDRLEERVLLRDIRSFITRHWDMAKTLRATPNSFGGGVDGIARLAPGNTRTLTRASTAWVYRADQLVVAALNDTEKHDLDGDLYESASTNEVIQSAFKTGTGSTFTGWTNAGAGSNGSAIAEDTGDNLFGSASDGSGRSVKFTAGNPIHASDLQITATATASILANTVCTASFWRKDDNGSPLQFAIQRAFDSQWWRESDQTWQVAKTWNSMSGTSVSARYITKQINVGANATTLTVVLGIPNAGGVRSQVNHLYHVQLEQKRYATSLIVTQATTVTRSADKLTISNNSSQRAWPEPVATFRCKARPWWSSSALAAGDKRTLFYAAHGASNYDWLYYDATAGALRFERKAAGVTYTASKTIALTAYTLYNVAIRVTSTAAELDLAAYTISVFAWADGSSGAASKGTDATAAALVVAGTADMEIGSQAGALNWDGNIWAQEVTQQVLTDSAVARY